MNSDIQTLKEAFSTLAGDFSTFSADVLTKLGSITPADPADVQTIKDVTAAVGDMDTKVKELDSKVNAA